MERLGVACLSCSSGPPPPPPRDDLDDFWRSAGDADGLRMAMLLEARREGGCGRGEWGGRLGDAADVRRDRGIGVGVGVDVVFIFGVGGAGERGLWP